MQYEWLMQKHILIYIGLVLLLSLIYFLIGRWIKKSKNSFESKRKSLFRLRGIFVLIFVGAFFITWASEIYSLIISITAIAAALAIATKEVILCYGGSFYRFFTHPFSVGDRIVIDDLRGDVVEIGLLGTQILEVGPKDLTHQYTGRLVTIPNAKFLSSTIFNETYSSDYILHTFSIKIKANSNWEREMDNILACAHQHCDQYIEKARKHFKKISQKKQLETPFIEPRVNIKLKDTDSIHLLVRVTVPVELRGRIEQAIVTDYLKEKFKS